MSLLGFIKLKGELLYATNPRRNHIKWFFVYVILIAVTLIGLYMMADSIKTHTVPTGQVQIGTTYSKYAVGETVSFFVANNYNSAIFLTNSCPSEPIAVYRQDNNKWVRIHDQAAEKDCLGEQRQVNIPARSSVTLSLAPWARLFSQAGKYRLVAVVGGYNALPYVDFEIVAASVASEQSESNTTKQSTTSTSQQSSHSQESDESTPHYTAPPTSTPVADPTPAPAPKPAAQTYTVHVTSSGNYDVTNLVLNAGDSIKFIYSKPYSGEVRTRFTPKAPTTTSISSVTVDSEFTTRTITINLLGTWTYRADDHSGNTGTLTVH